MNRPEPFRGEWHTAADRLAASSTASGVLRAMPLAVAVPADAADVAALVGWAAARGTPLVPRAAGTGMPGGNVASDAVAVDLMQCFGELGAVDAAARRVRVQPGATRAAVDRAAAPHGLQFPVDPSSGERCSIGGMLANNSAGAHSVRYGAARDWVEALDVVLADGTRCTLRRGEPVDAPPLRRILERLDAALAGAADAIERDWPRVRKNSSGYGLREYLASGDALDLLVGSEGTLALIVGAELRLAPRPERTGLAVLEFTALDAAAEAVTALLPLQPATCEMLDRTFLELVRSEDEDPGYPLRPGIEALLLVEVEGGSEPEVERALGSVAGAARGLADRVTTTAEPDRQQRFWHVRHAASPIIARRADGRVSMQFIEDGVVPVDRIADYVRALRRILERHGVPAVIFGHAGDGNLHVNPLVDVRVPGWQRTVERILFEVADAIAALGGTLAGEHGDGRLRAPLLERVWGQPMVDRFRAVKRAFDPAGILNPGVILPLPGQRPLDLLPADPAAPKPGGIPA